MSFLHFGYAHHKLRQESILLFPFVMLNLVQHLILVGFKPYENLKRVQVDVSAAKVMRIIRFGKWKIVKQPGLL